ncbi:MBL fold metallo-hydrolase [Amycolatopsis rubida]|uniref:MBL fold metallo-hydrolase n=1 Tax=Amycolatopsis rubida TaxID=112413 RepID=A0ABX0C060_9PSEU|nr:MULTISPECIES: MBL fold metallo-hydrolase [Amycolatopsis]MYW96228.1 MBL fold metallo-hydrolase [Amycolatopsis rubida]NEC61219.1 MBL fold metallo-hydrolase [Amycolatopsis rubida]OAP24255.1 Hydroxyacylglutathione hydrolase [Amycolatopsis sp. M39]
MHDSSSLAARSGAYGRPEERPTRQVGGWAVAGGVWATVVPFPSPLAYSYSYALRYPEGLVVVDLGWDSDEAWQAFLRGLARAGASLDEVRGVVATHAHPDHYGLARRIREHTSAWIAAHPGERAQIRVDAAERRERIDEIAAWLRYCGVPRSLAAELRGELEALDAVLPAVEPDVELVDGAPVPGTEGSLLAVHTPGHTAGHLCFHERERNLLLTGDHVLPKVTPNVAFRPGSDPDPLRDFLGSLARLRRIPDATVVLPGHEWSFDRVSDRVGVLHEHHRDRLSEIEHAVAQGCDTVWKVASAVSWARDFSAFTPRSMRSALAETAAHLVRLAGSGRITRLPGTPGHWVANDCETR